MAITTRTSAGAFALFLTAGSLAAGGGDCNGNGVPDATDIAEGTSLDDNGNGVPDECEPRFVGGAILVSGFADGPDGSDNATVSGSVSTFEAGGSGSTGSGLVEASASTQASIDGAGASYVVDVTASCVAEQPEDYGGIAFLSISTDTKDLESAPLLLDLPDAYAYSIAGGGVSFSADTGSIGGDRLEAGRYRIEYSASVSVDEFVLFDETTIAWTLTLTPIDAGNPADLDGDGTVDGADLVVLLAAWGPCGASCPADFDGNGVVNGADLAFLLDAWG